MSANERNPEDIFHRASEITDPVERKAYLDEACGSDKRLRDEVEALLLSDEQAGSFLGSPVLDGDPTLEKPSFTEITGTKVGRYELLKQIGEGGMGLVYLAEQKRPVRRQVALKIIKPGMDSKEVIGRFEAERQTLALLDHPNIARVLDAGTTSKGLPYFVMEYVKGMSITRYCDDRKLNVEQRLKLFKDVCEALHHAHQKGIIHRDIKPSNILVSVHGDRAVPKVIDFGIAKATSRPLTDKTVFTYQGQLLGTPEYMSPEQVDLATQDIDTRSDIYSLGILLYELLAGVTPFEKGSFLGGGFAEIQRTIRDQVPATPSTRLTNLGEEAHEIAKSRKMQVVSLARCLHRELEWIPMKAMRKDRCRRYRSASEMADDIQNYLNGSPLIAGPETAVYRMQKFARKHAGSVATVALTATAIILGLIISIAMYVKAEEARENEVVERSRAEKAEKVAEDRAEDYRRGLYANTIQLSDAKYHEGNIGAVRRLLESCPQDLRAWEWDRVNHVLDQPLMSFTAYKDLVDSVALSPVNSAALSPDGKCVVAGGYDKAVKIWDISTGKELITLPGSHSSGWVPCVAFSPDGKQIVSCDEVGRTTVWDAAGGNEAIISIEHGNDWVDASFSPDGKHIVSVGTDSDAIKVWDVVTGAEVIAFNHGHQGGATCVAFSPDGKRIVSGDSDGAIKIWDAAAGNEVTKLTGHEQTILSFSFSSDSKLLASSSNANTIKIWDAITGSILMILRGHDGPIDSVAFSPDDKYLVSGGNDCTIRIWDIVTGEEMTTLRGHEGFVTLAVFTPDGKQIVSGSWDGKIKVWDVTVDRELSEFLGHKSALFSVAFSPNGKRLVSRSMDGKLKVWDVASAAEVMTLSGKRGINFASAVFSPDGRRIASLNEESAIVIWDAETGAEVATLGGQEERGSCLAFSPDGKRIVSGSEEGTMKLWDMEKGEEIITWAGGNRILSIAFSPDGKRVVSGGRDKNIRVWDATSGAELLELIGHEGPIILSVAFSPDSKHIASACQEDGTARIWDAVTGRELMTLRGHGDVVASVAFSPDGKRLVTGSRDRTARVWDLSTGDELLTLRADSGLFDVAFSPDGKTIAGGTWGKTVVLWESAEPAGGYGPRKTTAAARKLVDELYEKLGWYYDVIDKLNADKALDEQAGKASLQIANSRKCEDAEKLTKEGWEIVSSADKDIEAYKSILETAQKVARSEPKTPSILTTLGVGQYRVGAYADALDTLKHAEKMRTDGDLESDLNSVAFTAMTLYRLGQVDQGRAAISTLRDELEKITFADITSGKLSHRIEAEKVFAGTNKQLIAVWELISKKELDRAVDMSTELQSPSKEADSEFDFSLEGIVRYLSRALYARGKSHFDGENPDYVNILSDHEAAVQIDPNYVSALKDIAWLQATCDIGDAKDPARAIEIATLACQVTDWRDQNNLKTAHDFYLSGNKFCHDGKYEEAISTFITSAELDPDYYYTHINLGVALARTRQFKKAIQEFTLCISKKWGSGSDRFVFYFNRAIAAEAAGDKGLALNDRATLEKLDPLRARKVKVSGDYILMDVNYMERRNQADKDRLLNTNRTSITKGKVVIRQVAKLEKNKQEHEAIGLISGTLKEVSSVLADYTSYPKFMPDVEEITVRISADEGTIVDHKLGLPLGFVKKYRLKFHSKNEDGRTQMSWKKLPWPGLKAKETVVDTYGQWIIEDFPDKDGQVLAYYRVYTDIGKIPLGTGWIVDFLTTESIEDMFKGTRRRVKELYH